MKKTILSALFASSIMVGFAQTIDTMVYKPLSLVRLVVPFKPNFGDTTAAVFMGVTSKSDNLKDYAVFHYALFQGRWKETITVKRADGVTDSSYTIDKGGKALFAGDVECSGLDYKNWTGDNKYPFQFVASKLGLPIK